MVKLSVSTRSQHRRLASISLIAGLSLSACSEPPTATDLKMAVLEASAKDEVVNISNSEARCIADSLLASNLSDTTLSGLALSFDQPQVVVDEAEKVQELVNQATVYCSE